MGALDILTGRQPLPPSAQPWGTSQRAIVGQGGGSARSVGASLGSTLYVPGAKSWTNNTAAGRCVLTTAANLASVDLVVIRGDEPVEDHEVSRIYNQGSVGAPTSARVVRESVFAQAEVRGEGFAYLDRGPTGAGPIRSWSAIYDEVDVVIEDDPDVPHRTRVRGFVVRRGNQKWGLLPSEVLWVRYPHPTKEWHALAPWALACGAAELDSYARAWQLGEFKNGAKPGSVIYLGDLDERQYAQAVADFKTGVEGAHNAGKSLLVAGQAKASVSRLSMTPEEMSYLTTRRQNDDEVMLAFGYRPDYFRGQSTYENQRAAKTAQWSENLLGKLDVVGSELDRQLLPNLDEQAGFDVSKVDALQENADAIYNRIRGIAYTDTLTMDESRAQLGLEPLPDGEGQYTLTEYRARIALRNTPPESGEQARLATRPQVVTAALPRSRRVIRMGGELRLFATDTRRKRKAVKRPSTESFYSTHERVGERAVRALAEKQLRVVLRNLSKLRTSELATWSRHAEQCGWLTIGVGDPAEPETQGILGRMVAAGDGTLHTRAMQALHRGDDGNLHTDLGMSPWSSLSPTMPCECERIAADSVFDAGYWRGQTDEALESWLRGVWEGAGSQMANGLGVSFDVFDQRVLDAMDKRRAVLAEQVTQTTRRVLDSSLLQIIAEDGWSIEDAQQAIRGVFDDLSGYRARTIARTEVVGGYNAASNIAARASGVVTARTWLTAEDERVRKSHQRLNGHRLTDTKDRYPNGLRFPGDPTGDPSETVNCRCVETYDV